MALTDGVYCAGCNVRMRESFTDHEYEEGVKLTHCPCYLCPQCKKVSFMEDQAKDMKRRTQEIKNKRFAFERIITMSGTSLSIGVPAEIAEHLKLKKGSKVRIVPMQDKGFLVEV